MCPPPTLFQPLLPIGNTNESYDPDVKIGDTMAGEFTPGLFGGQRKLMIFELVKQRVANQNAWPAA